MPDNLGKLMQALDAGKAKQGLPALPSTKGSPKPDLHHTWKKTAFDTIGGVRAKKRGSGKH